MNAWLGWGLAAAAVAIGWLQYRWQGLALALSVIVFWLLIQFSRSLRVLRNAADSPVGQVPSAVMLHSKLRTGLTLAQVVALTRSLGRRAAAAPEAPETWAWADASGAEVRIVFADGRCTGWALVRPADDATA